MDYEFKQPARLVRDAIDAAPGLLKQWRRKGRPKLGEKRPSGYGWHELFSNEFAGSHASGAALKLILNPRLPLRAATRRKWIDDVTHGVLLPFVAGDIGKASDDEKERLLEAQHCTAKVANFLSACALLRATKNHDATYRALERVIHRAARKVLAARRDGGWTHWLDTRHSEPVQTFPTATCYDALHRLGSVDTTVRRVAERAIREYVESVFGQFRDLFIQHGERPPPLELWKLLPALRTVAHMGDEWLIFAPHDFCANPANFERILNAYVSHELFGFGLNQTDDFQKYRSNSKASGTDYVSFNTTACLVRSIIECIQNRKAHRGYGEWIAPHLCAWAEQIVSNRLPQPARFSYIHQALSCLLAAADLPPKPRSIPRRIRMNVFPRVFAKHSFARKPRQGFYITPFDFDKALGMTKSSDALFSTFKTICEAFHAVPGESLSLVRGDHAQSGVITERIWQYLNESQFIIAVCVGANANVYYEIGVADTLGKPVLLIGRRSGAGAKKRGTAGGVGIDFKFDIAGIYHHEFEVDRFDTHNIRPVLEAFLKKVYLV